MSGILQKRASGVLMHISSLPGNTGIGTLGKHAYEFVDFLKAAGQNYWQILPICPTSYGDSPYQSFSTFAGNPYFIDIDLLIKDGYIKQTEADQFEWGKNRTSVDYANLYKNRHRLFKIVWLNFSNNPPPGYKEFCDVNKFWLDDYSLFMAVKDLYNGKPFSEWEDSVKFRKPEALEEYKKRCEVRIQYHKMLQYLFFKQWGDLKAYANEKGIKIIGDIPIYVAADSADVWSNPKDFILGEDLTPVVVAGCPPDGFSADGQYWGNPVYDWKYMKKTRYSWWKKRLEMNLKNYDILRIDHFRGFESFYCIPFGSKTAKDGRWEKGPGLDFINDIKKEFGELPIIAEDLGFVTDDVKKMLDESGFPGMKVLQFAFDSRESSNYLPHCYPRNCVVYTGTHDNDTIIGWQKHVVPEDLKKACAYLCVSKSKDLRENMMKAAMQSVANTCILTMQDLIGIGTEGRMNIPSTLGINWKWRAKENQINGKIAEKLLEYTRLYSRV